MSPRLLPVSNKSISVRIIIKSVTIGEILTPWHEHILRTVVLSHVQSVHGHSLGLEIGVEGGERLVVDDGLGDVLEVTLIVAHVGWEPVHVLENVSEDLDGITQALIEWLPHELHGLVSQSLLTILVIQTTEDERIKAHISEETRVRIGMTEGVDVPADGGNVVELLEQEFVTDDHVVHHVVVVSASLVVH